MLLRFPRPDAGMAGIVGLDRCLQQYSGVQWLARLFHYPREDVDLQSLPLTSPGLGAPNPAGLPEAQRRMSEL